MEATRGPILFRCDGTAALGWEALYQCLSLAAALQRRRRGTHFFSYLEPLSLATAIHRGNNEWHPAEQPLGADGDLAATIAKARALGAAAIIIAGAGMTTEYLATLRQETGAVILVFDSTAAIELPVDILVNPLLAPGKKAFRIGPGCQRLLGARFALCRGVFRRQRAIRATEPLPPFRALLAWGDHDASDQVVQRAEQLLALDRLAKVSVAARSHHPCYPELQELAARSQGRLEVITENKELLTRLVRVHFALTAGDAWAPELCVVGIPQLIISTTVRHALNGRKMDEEGVATYLGDASEVTAEQLHAAIDLLLEDPMERKGMTRCARNMFDGRGPDRIVNGLEILLHAPARRRAALRLSAAA
ncbi:MAG: polysaccharide biosynthesis protein [Gemmataceae bacterium]|nr:polysaccharide biosynthesis protein [Gemmataceae bacterium]MDW8243686.1 polysaccharide biosynthesis protein [Thermogemmata sp.]